MNFLDLAFANSCSCCDGSGMHGCPDCWDGTNDGKTPCPTCEGAGWRTCHACYETGLSKDQHIHMCEHNLYKVVKRWALRRWKRDARKRRQARKRRRGWA